MIPVLYDNSGRAGLIIEKFIFESHIVKLISFTQDPYDLNPDD